MKCLAAGVLLFASCAGSARADASTIGSVSWVGKSASYTIRGKTTATASVSADNDACTVKITVDGKNHEVKITKARLECGGAKVALDSFTKVEVHADGDGVRVTVDGRQVLPRIRK